MDASNRATSKERAMTITHRGLTYFVWDEAELKLLVLQLHFVSAA
jgi:hypothetical protein